MVGNQIRELRRKFNMTQAQLATHIGVSTGAIGLWETNKREPDNSTIVKIANIFSVSTDYILGNKKDNCIIIGRNGDYKHFDLNENDLKAVENLAKSLSENN